MFGLAHAMRQTATPSEPPHWPAPVLACRSACGWHVTPDFCSLCTAGLASVQAALTPLLCNTWVSVVGRWHGTAHEHNALPKDGATNMVEMTLWARYTCLLTGMSSVVNHSTVQHACRPAACVVMGHESLQPDGSCICGLNTHTQDIATRP